MAAAGGAECSGIGDSVVVRRDIAAVAGTSASVADLLPDCLLYTSDAADE